MPDSTKYKWDTLKVNLYADDYKYAVLSEVNNSVPDIIEILSGTELSMTTYDSFGANGLTWSAIKNGSELKTEYSERLGSIHPSLQVDLDSVVPSDICIYNRAGHRAYVVGETIECFNASGVKTTTIPNVTNYIGGSLREDGSAVDVVSGASAAVTGNITVTSTITAYSTVDGSVIESRVEVNLANQMVIGCYRSKPDSLLNLVKTVFDETAIAISSEIRQVYGYNASYVQDSGYVISKACSYVTNTYTEDAEFLCFNKTSGDYVRIFTK
jgi:hypothetical protein